MQKWEYVLGLLENQDLGNLPSFLNGMGDEGWELVQITNNPKDVMWTGSTPVAVFKRPKG